MYLHLMKPHTERKEKMKAAEIKQFLRRVVLLSWRLSVWTADRWALKGEARGEDTQHELHSRGKVMAFPSRHTHLSLPCLHLTALWHTDYTPIPHPSISPLTTAETWGRGGQGRSIKGRSHNEDISLFYCREIRHTVHFKTTKPLRVS